MAMIHTELSPAAALQASITKLRSTLPSIIGYPLGPVLLALHAYVDSVERELRALETRLQGLDKMPSPAALAVLVRQ